MSDPILELAELHNLLSAMPAVTIAVPVEPLVTDNINPFTADSMLLLLYGHRE